MSHSLPRSLTPLSHTYTHAAAQDSGGGESYFDNYLYGTGGGARLWMPPLWSPNTSFSFDDGQDYTHKQYAGLVAQPAGGRSRMHNWELTDDVWVHSLNDGFSDNWMFRVSNVSAERGAVDFADPLTEHGGGWQDQVVPPLTLIHVCPRLHSALNYYRLDPPDSHCTSLSICLILTLTLPHSHSHSVLLASFASAHTPRLRRQGQVGRRTACGSSKVSRQN